MIHKVPYEIREGYWSPFTLKDSENEYPEVEGKVSFTVEHLRIKATVTDQHFKDGDRSWRYGDGFLINFITETYPESKPSPYFYAYGFSRMAGENHSVLVCHNGTYFLGTEDFKPEIEISETHNQGVYDIKVPWWKLAPFHPLIDKALGVNIRYNSQNDDGSTTRLQLVEDEHFESELVMEKKYHPLKLTQSDKSLTQIAFRMESNLVTDDETPGIVTVFSDRPQEAKLIIHLKNGDTVIHKAYMELQLGKGTQDIDVTIPTPDKTASYDLEITLNDLMGNHKFYRLKSNEVHQLENRINEYKERVDSPIMESSLHGLNYKLDELRIAVAGFRHKEDPAAIKNQVDGLNSLLAMVESRGHIYSEGYIRTAFKSSDDHTLQPYSLVLPSQFDPEKDYKLLVCLHGSGVDEIQFIGLLSERLEVFDDDYILCAPRGRDLSDYYVGQTEKDVIQMLQTIKSMLQITHNLIFGFSMGGYGVWRLTFLYPEVFDAAIIGSGTITNHRRSELEMDIRNLKRGEKHIPYLVMHGTEDRAVPYSPVEEFVRQLIQEGYNITFEPFQGAGHGNYNPLESIQKWRTLINV